MDETHKNETQTGDKTQTYEKAQTDNKVQTDGKAQTDDKAHKYYPGKNLKVFLEEHPDISFTGMFKIVKLLVHKLSSYHKKLEMLPIEDGIIKAKIVTKLHNDIKPENIIIRGENGNFVVDFIDNTELEGTPAYSKRDGYNLSEASDYYNLGRVFYYMLTRKDPEEKLVYEEWTNPFMKSIIEYLTPATESESQWEIIQNTLLPNFNQNDFDVDEIYALVVSDMAHCCFIMEKIKEKIALDSSVMDYFGIHFAEMGIITPFFFFFLKNGIIDKSYYDYLSLFASLHLPTIPGKVAFDYWNFFKFNNGIGSINAHLYLIDDIKNVNTNVNSVFYLGLDILYIYNISYNDTLSFFLQMAPWDIGTKDCQFTKVVDTYFLYSSLMKYFDVDQVQCIIGDAIKENLIESPEYIDEDFFHNSRNSLNAVVPISSESEAVDLLDLQLRYVESRYTESRYKERQSYNSDYLMAEAVLFSEVARRIPIGQTLNQVFYYNLNGVIVDGRVLECSYFDSRDEFFDSLGFMPDCLKADDFKVPKFTPACSQIQIDKTSERKVYEGKYRVVNDVLSLVADPDFPNLVKEEELQELSSLIYGFIENKAVKKLTENKENETLNENKENEKANTIDVVIIENAKVFMSKIEERRKKYMKKGS